MSKIPLVKDVTPEMKEQWREKHEELKLVTVTMKNTGEKKQFIVGKPTRTMLDVISSYDDAGRKDKVRAVLEGCILAGEIELVKDEKQADLANTLYGRITDLLEKLQSEVGEV